MFSPRPLILAALVLAVAFFSDDARAVSIRGTVWTAANPEGCEDAEGPGPDRLRGLRVALCDEGGEILLRANGEPLIDETDDDGEYSFRNLLEFWPRTAFHVGLLDLPVDTNLVAISCRNTRNQPGACHEMPGQPNPAPCGDVNLDDATIVIDVAFAFPIDRCESVVNGIDFVFCDLGSESATEKPPEDPDRPPSSPGEQQAPESAPRDCWATGGGTFFDEVSRSWSAEILPSEGSPDTVSGLLLPSCQADAERSGSWTHVSRSLGISFIAEEIETLGCGLSGGASGTAFSSCDTGALEFGSVEFTGSGRIEVIGGGLESSEPVTFFARIEDWNARGSEQGARSGAGVDRYYLLVLDESDEVRLLIDEDEDPRTIDPRTITRGNLEVLCTECSPAGVPLPVPHEVARLFLRGDSNFDGQVDVADPIHSLTFLFQHGEPPPCLDGADINDDGRIDVTDAVASLRQIFRVDSDESAPALDPEFDRSYDGESCLLGAS